MTDSKTTFLDKRTALGFSLQQVAEKAGFSASTIQMIENNKKPPSEAEIRKLGQALKFTESEIEAMILSGSRPKNKEASGVIGSRIAAARNMRSYTQLKLSQLASITPAALSQIEAGLRSPSSPVLKNLAEALKVSADYLLGNTENDQGELSKIDDLSLQRAFRSADKLTENDKQKISEFIEFLSLKSQKNNQE
jgi:transcriptional regulator with XRE-family HTH domain